MQFLNFFIQSKQTTICNYIDRIANKTSSQQEIVLDSFPKEFGKEFIIGTEIAKSDKSTTDKSRYYYLSCIVDFINEPGCFRGIKKGILQVTDRGELHLLDDQYNPLDADASFIFENGNLELHENGWLAYKYPDKGFPLRIPNGLLMYNRNTINVSSNKDNDPNCNIIDTKSDTAIPDSQNKLAEHGAFVLTKSYRPGHR